MIGKPTGRHKKAILHTFAFFLLPFFLLSPLQGISAFNFVETEESERSERSERACEEKPVETVANHKRSSEFPPLSRALAAYRRHLNNTLFRADRSLSLQTSIATLFPPLRC